MAALPLPAGLDGYVFKAKSPSCGIHGIPRYAPSGQPSDHRGRGVFAQRVIARFPLLPAEDEGRLNDAVLREEFTERVFAFARLRELLSGPWEPRDLVSFHARHKLQLLAHDPPRYRAAGRIVAAAGSVPREVTELAYRDVFQAAMTTGPAGAVTRTHSTTRSAGSAAGWAPADDLDLVARIESYRRGADPLSVPVAILAHYASDGELPWLAGQSYLEPFPAALRLRHSVPR